MVYSQTWILIFFCIFDIIVVSTIAYFCLSFGFVRVILTDSSYPSFDASKHQSGKHYISGPCRN